MKFVVEDGCLYAVDKDHYFFIFAGVAHDFNGEAHSLESILENTVNSNATSKTDQNIISRIENLEVATFGCINP